MVESKHTPGPWTMRIAGNGDCGISAEGTGVFAEAFAEIRHSGENARDEAKANARLIAAAPDLLDALKEMRAAVFGATVGDEPDVYHDYDRLSSLAALVISVIDEAEGRS
ncbi:putative secreted protein [Rhizobium leguminosarum]|uniref:hypothetical protein n=1 Tax=Rhizobium leguminosarum TaxID=384 RepID=UPI00161F4A4E|nr:hypothetical protein [Rhizobium leguminosarum]MBB5663219.1 putative secreted protein [Rhizobium leguminosarum]